MHLSNYFLPISIIIVILVGVILNLETHPKLTQGKLQSSAPIPIPIPLPTNSAVPSPFSSPSSYFIPSTPSPSPYHQSQNPNPSTSSNNNLSDFKYPNSSITSQTSSQLMLTSNDSPNSITNWYKNKIKSLGMSTTSFVQTSTNNSILNKLVGDDGGKKVSVEISKGASDVQTKILVSLSY